MIGMMMLMMMMLCSRSQGKEKEAETLLKDSVRFGPHFADAYSSLASLYAEQVKRAENTKRTLPLFHSHTHTHTHICIPFDLHA